MRDPQKWKIAMSRFNGYYSNIPSWLKAEQIADYHGIVSALEEASGEDLSHFRIPREKLKPKIISVRPGGYRGGRGSAQYSQEDYCDSTYFQGQVDSLKHYLDDLDTGRRPNDAPQPSPSPTIYNVRDSNFINYSPGASIASNIGLQNEDLRLLVEAVRELLKRDDVSPQNREQINIDIGTIELQINSSRPNISILRESLKSLQAVAENAAGSLLASALTPMVLHALSKLP